MNYSDTNQLERTADCNEADSIPRVFELIQELDRKLQGIRRLSVKEAGLTPQQYVVLGALGERDARPLKELADAAHCSRPTVTGIVDVLERDGLVARRPNPADRRSLLVTLTDAGKARQQATPAMNDMLRDCCSGLRPDEVASLARLLDKLDQSLTSWKETL